MSQSSHDFRWLRSTGRYWILPLEKAATICLVAILPLGVIASLLGGRMTIGHVALVLVPTSLVLTIAQHLAFYHLIRCPVCGHNPTRYKNGKNMPTKTAWRSEERR